jgi:hypothetical protein
MEHGVNKPIKKKKVSAFCITEVSNSHKDATVAFDHPGQHLTHSQCISFSDHSCHFTG